MVRKRSLVAAPLVAFAAVVMSVSAAQADPPVGSASPTHAAYLSSVSGGTMRVAADFADPAADRVVLVMQGRDISTLGSRSPQELTFTEKVGLLRQRGIPLNGINVKSFTGATAEIKVNGKYYASVPELKDLVAHGGAVTSEGINHERLSQLAPGPRWDDVCGVQRSYYDSLGINVQSMYAYAGGPYDAKAQLELVSKCMAFGRTYGHADNALSTLGTSPWTLNVLSLNGGCNAPTRACGPYTTPRRYMTKEQLLAYLSPAPGRVAVVQPYHLVFGTSAATSGGAWDCSSADSDRHWTSATEIYCATDFYWAIDQMPAGIRVSTMPQLAAAVGRAPAQLPWITRPAYIASQR